MSSNIRREVKAALAHLRILINHLPKPKQQAAFQDIDKIYKGIDPEKEEGLETLKKNLKYRFDFLRLTNPKISIDINSLPKPEDIKEDESLSKIVEGFMKSLGINNTKGVAINIENTLEQISQPKEEIEAEEKKKKEEAEAERGEEESKGSGTYVMKDGKLVRGEAASRKPVDWSNWYAANVDPEDLKRHRELLDRQHFGGPVWEGVGRPKSIMDEENPIFDLEGEPEENPNLIHEKKPVWETVKR